SFNQDATCLVLGLRGGFRIYDCSPFVQRFSTGGGGLLHVEMLFCTSLVALVGGGDQPAFSPRRLRLWDTRKRAALCELNFVTAVLAVRLNRRRVVVALERALHVFDITCAMKCLHTLATVPNPRAVVAFSPNEENCHLAFPGTGVGEVVMYDALALKVLNKVAACKSRVAAMAFCRSGALLATASEQGTVVRVFTVPGAQQVFTLRRGTYSSAIRSLAFNQSATRLAVCGSSSTVHVFDTSLAPRASSAAAAAQQQQQRLRSGSGGSSGSSRQGSPSSGGGGGGSARRASGGSGVRLTAGIKQVAALLPLSKRATDYVDSSRAAAHARLRSGCTPRACALISDGAGSSGGGDSLLVCTDQGMLLRYAVPDGGGDCRLTCA
ncbi:autophagy-related protein 18, partial [Tribonema minus]